MTLTPEQLHRLRMEDGLVPESARNSAEELPFDPDADVHLRQQLRTLLMPPTVPPIAGAVMARIAAGNVPVGEAIREQAEEEVHLSRAVMGSLGAANNLGERYRAALRAEAGDLGSVWPDVAMAIGVESGSSIGDLLRGAVADEADFGEVVTGMAPQVRWRIPAVAGVLVAAAAALLLWVGSASTTAKDVAEKIAEGPVHIEHLDVGAANAVQVLQFGEDSPTIILLKDSDEQKGEGE